MILLQAADGKLQRTGTRVCSALLGVLAIFPSVTQASVPGCPSLPDLSVEAEYQAGQEREVRCDYSESVGLPWPAGRLRLLWVENGPVSPLSDLCGQGGGETHGDLRFFPFPGRAALVRVEPSSLHFLEPEVWEEAARALLAQVSKTSRDCGEAPEVSVRSTVPPASRGIAPPIQPVRPAGVDPKIRAQQVYREGEDLYYGRNGKKQDRATAFRLYREGAELGDVQCQYSVAYMLYKGQGVAANVGEALRWAKEAAASGHGQSCYFLGERYFYGQGVTKNLATAATWYQAGAKVGNGSSFYSLGYLFESGKGVAKDYGKAMRSYLMAAGKGNSAGMLGVGNLYFHGRGVKQDYRLAQQWFSKGAAKGQSSCLYRLGEIHEKGLGTRVNRKQAIDYYKQAATKGNSQAKKRLLQLKIKL